MYKGFNEDIIKMNKMFDLPVRQSIEPDKDLATKLYQLHNTLTDEVNELLDITAILDEPEFSDTMGKSAKYPIVTIDHYVSLADLLGDMIVYCASEANKHGIYLPEVLQAIMESQWSKLGANGEVIKDENGKFLKGENYQPPEPMIKKLLQARNGMVAVSKHPPYVIPENLENEPLMGSAEAMNRPIGIALEDSVKQEDGTYLCKAKLV